MSREIYLDNAATTRIHNAVLEEMMPFLERGYGNPGSVHTKGRTAKNAIELARSRVAKFINAKPEQIIFTSGGSEANTLAILGTKHERTARSKPRCIVNPLEHHSALFAVNSAFKQREITPCSVAIADKSQAFCNSVYVTMPPSDIDDVSLIVTMLENNEVPISYAYTYTQYLQKRHDAGALVHGDGVQALGFDKIDVRDAHRWYDTISMSGHKIHAPKGVGALFVRNPSILSPIILGGSAQEFGLRGGTENVAGIVGFGKACEMLMERPTRDYVSNIAMDFDSFLQDEFEKRDIIEHLRRNGRYEDTKVLSYSIYGVDAETLVLALSTQGVYVSASSACNGNSVEPSHVLKAIGLTDLQARQTIRVSFSVYNTEEDVKAAAELIAEISKELLEGQM